MFGGRWWPYAAPGVLCIDHVGAPSKDGGAITSGDVISAKEVATKVVEGLEMQCKSRETPLR